MFRSFCTSAVFAIVIVSGHALRADTLYKAINMNGSAQTIDGISFVAESGNATMTGGGRFSKSIAWSPSVSSSKKAMLDTSVWNSSGVMVVETPIANGTYNIYVYSVEDSGSQTFQLLFESKGYGGNQNTGSANTWKRLGPYNVSVSDGKLTMKVTGGHFMLAGLEIYKPTAVSGFPDGSKRVWLHEMIQLPTFEPSTPYGADYPLTLRPLWESPVRPQDGPALMKNAGVTGTQLLWGEGQQSLGQFTEKLQNYEGSGVEVAPCLAVQTISGGLSMIDQYLGEAQKYSSAATITVNGKKLYIISIYGARYSPADVKFWQDFQNALGSRPVYLTADIVTAISNNGGTLQPDKIDSFAKSSLRSFVGLFPSAWTFDIVDGGWADLVSLMGSKVNTFAGGSMPGYNRESAADGGYHDAEGTALFRRHLADVVKSKLSWNTIVSWNDVSERHNIWPGSEWSYTRADISAFYSALMRGVAFTAPLTSPQLYVTVPQRTNVGLAPRIGEALVLNTSTSAVTVSALIIDGSGKTLTSGSKTIAAKTADALQIPISFSSLPAGRYVRMKTTSTSSSGQVLQTVTSSPILVYNTNEQATGFEYSRVKYNSIPARMALSGTVSIALDANPVQTRTVARITKSAGGTVRFSEVLGNGYSVSRAIDPSGTPAHPVPLAAPYLNNSGVTVPVIKSGFYVGRIITSDERVGYSNPVYFAP